MGTTLRFETPVEYAVREAISGRFSDWPIESIKGWLLCKGIPPEECERIGAYIAADRDTIQLCRWWQHPQDRWWIDELKIMQSGMWTRRAK